jgi:hypothetical protein
MFLYGIGWFISFSLNPYNICVDHPDRDLKKEFYQCKPFSFVLKKGTILERKENQKTFPWEVHNQKIFEAEDVDKIKKRKELQRQRSRKNLMNEIRTYDCDPEFYSFSNEEKEEMSSEEILSYCRKKTRLHQRPSYNEMSQEL